MRSQHFLSGRDVNSPALVSTLPYHADLHRLIIGGGVIGYFRPDWGAPFISCATSFSTSSESSSRAARSIVFSPRSSSGSRARALGKSRPHGRESPLIYFEIVTTAALFIRPGCRQFLPKPGIGVTLATSEHRYRENDRTKPSENARPKRSSWRSPRHCPRSHGARRRASRSSRSAFSSPLALSAIGEKANRSVRAMESLSQVMFRF